MITRDPNDDINKRFDTDWKKFLASLPPEGEPGRLQRILSPGFIAFVDHRIELALEESHLLSTRRERLSAKERAIAGIMLEHAEASAVYCGTARQSLFINRGRVLGSMISLLRRHDIPPLYGLEDRLRDCVMLSVFNASEEGRT